MTLLLLIVIPLLAAAAAWIAGRRRPAWARWICVASLGLELVVWAGLWPRTWIAPGGQWLAVFHREWIPQLGIGFSLAADGLSLLLIGLTILLGLASVICSWTEITERVGFFHFNLMAVLAGIIGVFLATDLILFYFFWELMLVPMYFLIVIWGHENRRYAAMKFFIFTQAGGLFMLAAIIGLFIFHGQETGNYTFSYFELLSTRESWFSPWIMMGFFLAFAVKLPMVPFHTWLPDAHTEAPTAGSVILAGLLLKTGGYGIIRFVLPLFPVASLQFAPYAMVLGVVGILYGAVMAFSQEDLKRLVAYTSVSHLGFVLVGVFCMNQVGAQGAVMQMVCHGISTGALFIVVGMIQERIHTRELSRMGGLWTAMPRMGGMAMVFALASLGLPGLGNFVGEFLVLIGAYKAAPGIAAASALGLVLAAAYSLWFMRRAFFGPSAEDWRLPDLSGRETLVMVVLTALIVLLGVFPQPVLTAARTSLKATPAVKQSALSLHPWEQPAWSARRLPGRVVSSRVPEGPPCP